MQRRNFLKTSTLAGLGTQMTLGGMPVWANSEMPFGGLAEEDDRILVIVQMFGGNDALNTVIPADDDKYYSTFRKTLNIPRANTFRLGDSKSYLHPSLASGTNGGLNKLFKDGKLAVIQGVGYPKPNLSHFRSTDIWLSATMPVNDSQLLDSGWLGRMVKMDIGNTVPDYPPAMTIGRSTSLLFSAGSSDMAIAVENPKDFYDSAKGILSGDIMVENAVDYDFEKNFLIELADKTSKYSTLVNHHFGQGTNQTDYTESDKLQQQLKLVARLISGGLKTKMYLVSIDGFDTHADQGMMDGKHAYLLKSVSEGIANFMEDLRKQNLGKKVIGMTVSEFGRRPEQNESNGTDHGAAGVMFMFGDNVAGGLYGKAFDFSNLDKNRDFIYQYDYRSVYDEVIRKWYGKSEAVTQTLLNGRFPEIEKGLLFRQRILNNEPQKAKIEVSIGPNPAIGGICELKFELKAPSLLTASQADMFGRTVPIIPGVPLPAGKHKIPLRISGPSGNYIINLQTKEFSQSLKVIKQ